MIRHVKKVILKVVSQICVIECGPIQDRLMKGCEALQKFSYFVIRKISLNLWPERIKKKIDCLE